MKFLVIGNRGSMGKRRTQNLLELGHEVIGWDIIDGTKLPIGDFDGVFVCTPPDQHEQYMKFHIPTFVEASILPYTPLNSEYIYPSCTMRFHPTLKHLKENIHEHKPLSFIYHVGNYLPDWHPHDDYKKKYFAQRETGGCREIVPYETNWLTWLFGPCEVISSEYFKVSDLDMSATDYYRFSLGFDSGPIGSVTIDTLSRPKCRDLKLIYEGRLDEYDLQGVDWEDIYLRETMAFVDAITNKSRYPYTVEQDLWNLKLLSQIEFGVVEGE